MFIDLDIQNLFLLFTFVFNALIVAAILESRTSELRLVNAPISESSSLIDATTVDLFPVVRPLKVPISASSSFIAPTKSES